MECADKFLIVIERKVLRRTLERLRPALPRSVVERNTHRVTLHVCANRVTLTVVGAAIEAPADAQRVFTATALYGQLDAIARDDGPDGVAMEFDQGAIRVGPITINSTAIKVQPSDTTATPEPAIGAPLLRAFIHMRKYGKQLEIADKELAQEQVKASAALDRAAKNMMGFGVTRDDLVRLVDSRCGL